MAPLTPARAWIGCLVVALAAAGCGAESAVDAPVGTPPTSDDAAGGDAAARSPDADLDGDVAAAPADTGVDAGVDAGPDTRSDTSAADAGADASASDVDVGVRAPPDSSMAAADATLPAPDAAPPPDVALTFRVRVPAGTPLEPPVHVAGDFQGWDPADPSYALARAQDGLWTLIRRFEPGRPLAFKFARGDWSRVEKGPDGEEIGDRQVDVPEADATLDFTVARWADGGASTVTGDLRLFDVPGFPGGRTARVWLPPAYDADPAARFPVLYMFDGQNIFDAATSFSGEWGVDEAITVLGDTIDSPIVVAVDNGGANRILEYTPFVDPDDGQGGGGAAHLDAITDVLVPWVDATFRTRPRATERALSGSSLGGLMTVWAAYARADTFGRFAALSPSVWWADRALVDFVEAGDQPQVRLWVDHGGAEPDQEQFRALRDALETDGFVEGADYHAEVVPGAGHTEGAWAARYGEVLRFLFPPAAP